MLKFPKMRCARGAIFAQSGGIDGGPICFAMRCSRLPRPSLSPAPPLHLHPPSSLRPHPSSLRPDFPSPSGRFRVDSGTLSGRFGRPLDGVFPTPDTSITYVLKPTYPLISPPPATSSLFSFFSPQNPVHLPRT